MTDWFDQLQDRSQDSIKAERLANVLSKMKGTREAKIKYLTNNMPLMEAEAAKDFDPVKQPRQYGASMVSIAFRFWRNQLKGGNSARAVPGTGGYGYRRGRTNEMPVENLPRGERFVTVGALFDSIIDPKEDD